MKLQLDERSQVTLKHRRKGETSTFRFSADLYNWSAVGAICLIVGLLGIACHALGG